MGPFVPDLELVLGRSPESPSRAVDLGRIGRWVFISECDGAGRGGQRRVALGRVGNE